MILVFVEGEFQTFSWGNPEGGIAILGGQAWRTL